MVSSDGMTDAKREAVEALTALGYSSTEAYAAVRLDLLQGWIWRMWRDSESSS